MSSARAGCLSARCTCELRCRFDLPCCGLPMSHAAAFELRRRAHNIPCRLLGDSHGWHPSCSAARLPPACCHCSRRSTLPLARRGRAGRRRLGGGGVPAWCACRAAALRSKLPGLEPLPMARPGRARAPGERLAPGMARRPLPGRVSACPAAGASPSMCSRPLPRPRRPPSLRLQSPAHHGACCCCSGRRGAVTSRRGRCSARWEARGAGRCMRGPACHFRARQTAFRLAPPLPGSPQLPTAAPWHRHTASQPRSSVPAPVRGRAAITLLDRRCRSSAASGVPRKPDRAN